MVQKHRTIPKATPAKDVSPLRNMSQNKAAWCGSPQSSAGLSLAVAPSNAASCSRGVSADRWKYNNMVAQNRDQFNNLHFC